MSSFTDRLAVEKTGRREWTTTRDIVYHVGSLDSGWTIVVPAGFKTDGASVPRVLWIFLPPFGGDYDEAAVLHDYLYRTHFLELARVVADAILIEAMTVLQTGAVARWLMFIGVRVGGWVTYRKYRKAAERASQP